MAKTVKIVQLTTNQTLISEIAEIAAVVPLANMFGWTNDMRSMRKGKANSVMEFSHYEKVPDGLVEESVGVKK